MNAYLSLQEGTISGQTVRAHLEQEGSALLDKGEGHYYAIRECFKKSGDPLDFIFLGHSCYNGMLRFNRHGQFNVPFWRKPERFRRALVSTIVNQVEWAQNVMEGQDWKFVVQDWCSTVAHAQAGVLIYCDPHTSVATPTTTTDSRTTMRTNWPMR